MPCHDVCRQQQEWESLAPGPFTALPSRTPQAATSSCCKMMASGYTLRRPLKLVSTTSSSPQPHPPFPRVANPARSKTTPAVSGSDSIPAAQEMKSFLPAVTRQPSSSVFLCSSVQIIHLCVSTLVLDTLNIHLCFVVVIPGMIYCTRQPHC